MARDHCPDRRRAPRRHDEPRRHGGALLRADQGARRSRHVHQLARRSRRGGGSARAQGHDAAALRRAGGGEGQYRRRRLSHHRRLPGFRVYAKAGRNRCCEAARGRRHRYRQDQSRPVRYRIGRRALALWHSAQCDECQSCSGRLQLRFGGGRGQRHRAAVARHRHRRFGARAGGPQQHRRPEAEPRAGFHLWSRAGLPHARLRFDFHAHRRRRLDGTQRHGRHRRKGPLFARASAA